MDDVDLMFDGGDGSGGLAGMQVEEVGASADEAMI
jgi:hypothetical protein